MTRRSPPCISSYVQTIRLQEPPQVESTISNAAAAEAIALAIQLTAKLLWIVHFSAYGRFEKTLNDCDPLVTWQNIVSLTTHTTLKIVKADCIRVILGWK